MALATSSLPTPVSPQINTVLSVGATFCTSSATFTIAGDRPTMASGPILSSSSRRRHTFSRARRFLSAARATIARRASGENGLGRKSYAPPFIASTADSMLAYPVITTTITLASYSLSFASTSIPSMPGILRSRMTTPNDSFRAISRPWIPSSAAWVLYPSSVSAWTHPARMDSSSSMTRTLGIADIKISPGLGAD